MTEKDGRVKLDGVDEREAKSAKDLFKLLDDGNKAKKVTATAMNPDSSRSHSILSISIHTTNKDTQKTVIGKLLLVDLAGSDRLPCLWGSFLSPKDWF